MLITEQLEYFSMPMLSCKVICIYTCCQGECCSFFYSVTYHIASMHCYSHEGPDRLVTVNKTRCKNITSN